MTVNHAPTVHARAGEQSLTFTREFDAPAALVFRAHVEPELFKRWLGPRGTELHIATFDARTGGAFRYTVGDDAQWTFFGSYHEVIDGKRIVHTWQHVSDPQHPTLESLTFVDLPGGRCRLEGLSLYTSAEHCTETLAWDETGSGMDENFERLDELLPLIR